MWLEFRLKPTEYVETQTVDQEKLGVDRVNFSPCTRENQRM